MKRKLTVALSVILCAAIFSSCGLITVVTQPSPAPSSQAHSAGNAPDEQTYSSAQSLPGEEVYPHVETDPEDFADEISRRAARLIDPAVNRGIDALNAVDDDPAVTVARIGSAPLAREGLSENARALYDLMLEAARELEDYEFDEKKLPGSNPYGDSVDAMYAVFEDYPDLRMYFADNCVGTVHRPVYFLPNEFMKSCEDRERIKEEVALYRAVFDRIRDCMPQGLSDWSKCVYFAAVICAACTYDTDMLSVTDPFPAYNALVKGEAVCQGYTQAFRLLCRAEGMDCLSVIGSVYNDEDSDHIWNVFETNLGRRFVDVTFMDGSVERKNGVFDSEYFFMDEDDLDFEGHVPDYSKLR